MGEPIKVVILVDGVSVKKWVADSISWVSNSKDFEIKGVVLNTAVNSSKSSFFYRLLRWLDRKLFKAKSNPFGTVALPVDNALYYATKPIQKQYSDWLDDACLNFIKEQQPDIILRFGFRILRGEILGLPKFGVWSLHHGDNKINRGGPPGFWEVVNQDAISGVTLQKITEDLDGGKVIGRAFTKTDLLSFNRNQVNVFEIGVRLLEEKLQDLVNGKLAAETSVLDFYDQPLFKDPSNIKTIEIAFHFAFRIIKQAIRDFFYEEQWIISHSKKNNFEESIYRFQNLIPPKGTSWADPFPVFWEGELWLFAEEIKKNKLGKIVCFKYLQEKKCFGAPQTIIDEEFHLSYPFVFQQGKQWYMIPETGKSGEVYLYHSDNFPYSWKKQKVLVSGKSFYDVTPFEQEGNWYCFASERAKPTTTPNDLLHLFLLEEGPLGPWKKHPASPIKIDVRGGRCAGRVFSKEGRLFRPAQLGAPKYGYGIQFYEILQLDKNNYVEKLVNEITPNWVEGNLATHTFNQENGWQFIDCQRRVSKF